MSYFFRKSSLRRTNITLKAQLDTFKGFSKEIAYPANTEEKWHFCSRTAAALVNAISLIEALKKELFSVLAEIEQEISEAKKAERKEIIEELRGIENDIPYDATLLETDALLSAPRTRLAEVTHELTLTRQSARDRYEAGKNQSQMAFAERTPQEGKQNIPERDGIDLSQTLQTLLSLERRLQQPNTVDIDQSVPFGENLQTARTTLKPPSVTIPQFTGRIEEFP